MIHARLRDERQRLNCARPVLAFWAGVHTRTFADWETGKSSPTAVQLSKLAAHGVDVLYVITGERSEPVSIGQTLTPPEEALLGKYRMCSRLGKRVVGDVLDYAVQTSDIDHLPYDGEQASE